MLNTLNEFHAVSRVPKGRMVWIQTIEKLDKMSQDESTEFFKGGLEKVAQDLSQRDIRDIEVTGRRLHTGDIQEPLQDAYFHAIEVLGCLQAACSDGDYRNEILLNNCALLCAEIREALNG